MNLSSKQLKELEAKVQDRLYNNILCLTHFYPTTKEFDAVFKKNMFIKNNKAAFQQVIYYLFNILNPELVKEKITTWPLYDIKLEGTFRNEVVAFINHINAEYEYANIPHIMASHLVSPGGFRFSKFMLKLSILVTYNHLKQNKEIEVELLAPIKPHKNPAVTNLIINNLKAKTAGMEADLINKQKEFQQNCEKAAEEAAAIVAEQTKVEIDLSEANKCLNEKKEKRNTLDLEGAVAALNNVKEKIASLKHIKNLCDNGKELLTYLASDKPVLEFNKDEFIVPDSIKHLLKTEDGKLDLHQLFNGLNVLVENANLEMPAFTSDQLRDMTKLVTELNEKCEHLNHRLGLNQSELLEIVENFQPIDAPVVPSIKIPRIVIASADNNE